MRRRFLYLALIVTGTAMWHAPAQQPVEPGLSLTTQDRVEASGWWPTKGSAPRSLYAGSASCAGCHQAIAALQQTTPMYQAAAPVMQSKILATHASLKFHEAGLSYSLTRSATGVAYEVSDGTASTTAAAFWAFGAGVVGQTYVLKKGTAYVEARVSYYTSLSSLDITIGHSEHVPEGVDAAFGHTLKPDAVQRCFSCHNTMAVTSDVFEPMKAVPGVQCEACHGPGLRHVEAMKSQHFDGSSTTIMNPARLAPAESVDFCGACHRTWADIVEESQSAKGAMTVRFQPYRLENSRCWGKNGDARLTCMACHDPHQPLAREANAYDTKCLACHSSGRTPQSGTMAKTTCKVAQKNCPSCHMPTSELPQTHTVFTDHYIRVVSKTMGGAAVSGSD